MILFVGDNKGVLFIKEIVQAISSAFLNLILIQPTRRNEVLGIMNTAGVIYCRICMTKYRIRDGGTKNITYLHTLPYKVFNCFKCGLKLSKKNMDRSIGI